MDLPTSGIEIRGLSWGDFDGDGFVDLMGGSNVMGDRAANRSFVWRNDGGLRFVEQAETLGLVVPGRMSRQANWIDYDNDGALDLSLTDGYGDEGGHFLFHNDLAEPARSRSLSVMVLDEGGKRIPPGAEVRLFDREGQILGTRQVSTGGYNAQSAGPVHFGLARMQPVRVEVSYMGGKRVVIEDVDPRTFAGQRLVLTPDGPMVQR